jgi:hypothetical protein
MTECAVALAESSDVQTCRVMMCVYRLEARAEQRVSKNSTKTILRNVLICKSRQGVNVILQTTALYE